MGLMVQVSRPRGSSRSSDAMPAFLRTRLLAAEVFTDVLKRRVPLDDILAEKLGDSVLEPRDQALVRAIAYASFRRLGTIRAALAQRMAKGMPPSSGKLEALLITAVAQILELDVPDHAAVDCAMQLVQRDAHAKHFAKLANAVLRRIASEREAIAAGDPLALDTPSWLAKRWIAAYGEEIAHALASAHRHEPSLDISLKTQDADQCHIWAERLGGTLLPTGSVRLASKTPVRELSGYEAGEWWVQDAAAALPALLLQPQSSETILDLCAAPGGKTAQLAARGAQVVAVDRSPVRLERLTANMERLHLFVEARAVDALAITEGEYDAILLDAPCSATGTLRRHPDVAWTKTASDMTALSNLQRRLLAKAASLVKPGGRMVYCTCSLEPEEGENQIEAFLADNPEWRRSPVDALEIGGLTEAVTGKGDLRTLPCHGWPDHQGLDGFYASRLIRAG